ncbi:MAG: 1-(5-phosphoribosyl)-5-[(5-phosphoribosylamino)methylideneamino] imidazole-4-carboxamide isomerase [Pseudomonadota bacterium]
MRGGEFEVFPAIDLLDGQSVRLQRGEKATAQVVHPDPVQQLEEYKAAGARWVHVVNLNAAFGETVATSSGLGKTNEMIRRLSQSRDVQIQLGGGIRSPFALHEALDAGAARVVIGTWAVRALDEVSREIARCPERCVVGVDSWNGHIAVHGWTRTEALKTLDFARRLKDAGVQRVLYTEVERDGLLGGVGLEGTAALARDSGLLVIASGGVKDLEDIRALSLQAGVCGVVTGKALAAGTLQLQEALRLARPSEI